MRQLYVTVWCTRCHRVDVMPGTCGSCRWVPAFKYSAGFSLLTQLFVHTSSKRLTRSTIQPPGEPYLFTR